MNNETLPPRIFGLTVDNVGNMDEIVKTIKKIKAAAPNQKLIVRVVFDFNEKNSRRKNFVTAKPIFCPKRKFIKRQSRNFVRTLLSSVC